MGSSWNWGNFVSTPHVTCLITSPPPTNSSDGRFLLCPYLVFTALFNNYIIIIIFIFIFHFSPFFLYKLLLQYPQQPLPLPLFPPPPIFSPLLSLCYSVSDQVLGFCLIRSINPNFFFLFPASIRKH